MGKEFNLKSCAICGATFLPSGPRQLTCCDECKRLYRNNYQKQYLKNRRDELKKTEFYSKHSFEPVIEKAKEEHLSYGQAVAKMEKENGKEHICNNLIHSSDRFNIDRNGEGYPDPTAYSAIKNLEGAEGRDIEGEKFGRLLHTIWNMCSLAGFEIQGRITVVSKKTGRIWD